MTTEQPIVEVAQIIARGGAFRDEDAVRLARAYLLAVGVPIKAEAEHEGEAA